MKKTGLAFAMLIGCVHAVFAQSDFTSVYARRAIAKQHIRQIVCYWFKDAAKPGEAIMVDSLAFDVKGVCQVRKTSNYTYNYVFNDKGTLIQEVTRGKNKADSTLTIFRYDAKGNLILSVDVHRAADIKYPYPEYALHKFEYGPHNELLREYWVNEKGHVHQVQRYKYITTGLEAGLIKIVNFYDEHDKLIFIKKYHKNGQVKDYSVDNNKITFVAESTLNKRNDLEKFTDYYHMSPEALRKADQYGNVHIKRDTVTEVYTYTPTGFCSQKSTYKHDKLVEDMKWYFKQ